MDVLIIRGMIYIKELRPSSDGDKYLMNYSCRANDYEVLTVDQKGSDIV